MHIALAVVSFLRLFNPNESAVDAVLRCGHESRVVHVDAREVTDVEATRVCVIHSPAPLVAFETTSEGIESQLVLDANAACEPLPMAVPLYACERGTATAAVNPVEGATYAWTAESATITGGQGTPRVTVSLGDSLARLSVVVSSGSCSRTASGIIAVRKPLSIVELKVPGSAEAGSNVTIEWTYAAGSQPASQVLKGDLFPTPVNVPADQRKYTFTPNVGGTRTVELIASHAPVISTVTQPKGGRRRAAGSTLVTATNCAEVHATKQLTVRCNAVGPTIHAANEVESGVAFTARVTLDAGDTASWSVTGGTIVNGAESAEVEIVPDDLVTELQLGVNVARANSCSVESHSSLRVRPRQACVTNPPKANVALTGRGCRSATVQASFSGTPPFRGTWSDGKTFTTYDNSLTRDFASTGDFTILGFSDAQCRARGRHRHDSRQLQRPARLLVPVQRHARPRQRHRADLLRRPLQRKSAARDSLIHGDTLKQATLLCVLLLAQPLQAANDCAKTMSAPLFACKNGKGTAAVPEIADAIYNWTVTGGTITGGAGTPRVEIALTNAPQASLTCTITTHDCTSVVTGIISVRDPLVIASMNGPASVDQNAPVTLTWSYDGTTVPASQVLTGDAFPEPVVLSASERSYTFTPQSSGMKTIDLLASYATAVAATQPATGGKRRSAGRSTVGATACPDAHASVKVEVRGCLVARPRISAPTSTFAGMSFDASTTLGTGESAHWSATGATILVAEGDHVRLRADQEGTVKLTVRIEREPACFAESTANVSVRPRSEACPVTPSANVELLEQSCDRATLKVTFTGRAPFRGRWSDGTPFTSSTDTLTREVTRPGTYTLYEFSDDSCPGTVTGAVPYERYLPGVKLETVGGKCTNAKVVAKFTGQAPFTGKWRGGEWFTTSASQLTIDNPAVGSYQLEVLRDSRCPVNDAVSETVQILQPAPVARMVDRYCQYGIAQPSVPTLTVVFDSNMDQPPYKVWWSDGVVTSSDIPIQSRFDTSLKPGDTKTYEITRAATGQCEALVPVRTTVSSFRPPAQIDTSKTQRVVCVNAVGQAALSYVPPGAQLVWEILPAGQVLSGQGTSAITYSVPQPGNVKVQATTQYADGACSSSNSYETVLCMGPSSVTDFHADSATMKVNTSIKVRFALSNYEGWSVTADRAGNVTLNGCTNGQCSATFTDTLSQPGKVRLELHYSNHCDTHYKTAAVEVTIEP